MADRDEVIHTLTQTIPSTYHEPTFAKMLEDVRTGRTILTDAEFAAIVSVRDDILSKQYDESQSLDVEDWELSEANRRCSYCGQFMGKRVDHAECDASTYDDELHTRLVRQIVPAKKERTGYVGYSASERPRESYNWSRMTRKEKLSASLLIKDEGVSVIKGTLAGTPEQMEDLFVSRRSVERWRSSSVFDDDYGMMQRSLRECVITAYLKTSFFGKQRMELPQGLRDAFLDNPLKVTPQVVMTIAATIDPPLSSREITRIIEVGGPRYLQAILNVRRVRDSALSTATNFPSVSAMFYAEMGRLPDESVRYMATNPDPLVRCAAAIAPNLAEDDYDLLAADSDPRVRIALIYPQSAYSHVPAQASAHDEALISRVYEAERTYDHGHTDSLVVRVPRLLDTFVATDPDDEVARVALRTMPFSRQAFNAISKVKDRERMQVISEEYRSIVKDVKPEPEPPRERTNIDRLFPRRPIPHSHFEEYREREAAEEEAGRFLSGERWRGKEYYYGEEDPIQHRKPHSDEEKAILKEINQLVNSRLASLPAVANMPTAKQASR